MQGFLFFIGIDFCGTNTQYKTGHYLSLFEVGSSETFRILSREDRYSNSNVFSEKVYSCFSTFPFVIFTCKCHIFSYICTPLKKEKLFGWPLQQINALITNIIHHFMCIIRVESIYLWCACFISFTFSKPTKSALIYVVQKGY